MVKNDILIQNRLEILATRPYRAKFNLQSAERAMVEQKGVATIRKHAAELIAKRLAPAFPARDGKQTPYKGHPVFVAQHATATCCRSCLERWHHISKGRELALRQQEYIVDIITAWIMRQENNIKSIAQR